MQHYPSTYAGLRREGGWHRVEVHTVLSRLKKGEYLSLTQRMTHPLYESAFWSTSDWPQPEASTARESEVFFHLGHWYNTDPSHTSALNFCHFSSFAFRNTSEIVFPTGQIFLPPYEIPVLLVAGSVRGELDRVCRVLVLHGAVSWSRLQKFNCEYFISLIKYIHLRQNAQRVSIAIFSATNTEKGSSTARLAAACVRKTRFTWGSASLQIPTARSVFISSTLQSY